MMNSAGKKLDISSPISSQRSKMMYHKKHVTDIIRILPKMANMKAMYSTKVNLAAFLRIKINALNADRQKCVDLRAT